jgi:hypothetical protein
MNQTPRHILPYKNELHSRRSIPVKKKRIILPNTLSYNRRMDQPLKYNPKYMSEFICINLDHHDK